MTDSPVSAGEPAGSGVSDELNHFVQTLGLIFRHSSVYGHSHSVTQEAIKEGFGFLSTAFEASDSVDFAIVDGDLLVNRLPLPSSTPAVEALAERMIKIETSSFSFRKGMTLEELSAVMEIIEASPEEMKAAGGFSTVISSLNLTHVSAKKVIFKQIEEDDLIVSKKKLAKDIGSDEIEDVVGFLKGTAGDSKEATDSLQAVASDAHKLAEAVVDAAGVAEGNLDAAAGGRIQECVKRVYEELSSGSKAKTQKGKKELIKNMDKLKVELQSAVHDRSGDEASTIERDIAEEIDGMKDDLMIDSLATEYAKKQNAIDTSEQRILRYMKRLHGATSESTSLKDRLLAGGLSEDAWEDLVEKSSELHESDAEQDAEPQAKLAAEALVTSLSKLEHILGGAGIGPGAGGGTGPGRGQGVGGAGAGLAIGGGGAGAEEAVESENLGRVVKEIADQVDELAVRAEDRMAKFLKKARSSRKPGKKKSGPTRKAIVEFLGEMVQELRQPLAVITSTIDALQGGMLGDVNNVQVEMLGLAADSATRLDHLTDKLLEISGLPSELAPDAKILESVYDGNAPQAGLGEK